MDKILKENTVSKFKRAEERFINYSTSKALIKSTKNFLTVRPLPFMHFCLNKHAVFYGWGRKKSGLKALNLAKKYKGSFCLLEDGFIRSVGLGVDNAPSFSLIEDKIGIYYDATKPSELEHLLNTYDFTSDETIMGIADDAMAFMKEKKLCKYNYTSVHPEGLFEKENNQRILIIAQTSGDASLVYGLAKEVTTLQMIKDARVENPEASLYLKIHPDVISGKKSSDLNRDEIPKYCTVIEEAANPIALLSYFDKVYTKTSGMGMEALVLGLEVVCYGIPYYAGWGITTDKQHCERRKRKRSVSEVFAAAYILYTRYYNPYTEKVSDILDTMQTIVKYRDRVAEEEGSVYFFGFSRWKRKHVAHFFPESDICFCRTLKQAKAQGLSQESKVYIWGKKPFQELEAYAKEKKIALRRVEDGFVRSVSLGSDLTKAYSLVVDSRGIYFDPTRTSDLEYLLETSTFSPKLLLRAQKLQQYLLEHKLSKYNNDKDTALSLRGVTEGQTVILVPGQVEDDASIVYGAKGMNNLELLRQTRKNRPEAYIIYKPHPDVLAGNRKGHISSEIAEQYCDCIVTHVSVDSVLVYCDELHTMTSLVGFEALMRGKRVYTYGLPFYAGWGLTKDKMVCQRRTRTLSLDVLVAATLIVYPRYLNPRNNHPCEIEVLLEEIAKEKRRYTSQKIYRLSREIRNFISRKIQWGIKVVLGE